MTTISIPNTGYNVGTCGWLAKGLQDGTIQIRPGTSKSGKGGLWIHCGDKHGCLAIFNEYDLTEIDMPGANRFGVCTDDFAGTFPLTEAAENYLRAAAQEWCDAANELRESDNPVMPKLAIAN